MKTHKNLLTLFLTVLFSTPHIFCMGEDGDSGDEWENVSTTSENPEQQKFDAIAYLKQKINDHRDPDRRVIDPENLSFNKTEETTKVIGLWDATKNIFGKRGLNTVLTNNANYDSTDPLTFSDSQTKQFENLNDQDQKDLAMHWKLTHDQKTTNLLERAERNYHRLMSDLKYGIQAKVFKEIATLKSNINKNNTKIDKLEQDLRNPKISTADKTLTTETRDFLRKQNNANRDSIKSKLEIINNQIKTYDTALKNTINNILQNHGIKTQNFITFFNSLNPKSIMSIPTPVESTGASEENSSTLTPTPPSTPRSKHSFSLEPSMTTPKLSPEEQAKIDFSNAFQFAMQHPENTENGRSTTTAAQEQTLSQLTDDLLAIKDLTLEKRQELTTQAKLMKPEILRDLIFKLWQKINAQGDTPEENSIYQLFNAVQKEKQNS